jgi:ribonuclease BN (tRNA processing enzyme)
VGLRLTVLGSCGSYPGPGQACSGYLVRSDDTTLLIEAGSGTLANLQHHVAIEDVDAIVVSHEHPDHWADLTGFYVAAKYYLGITNVPVFAPASVRDHVYYNDRPLDWQIVSAGDRRTFRDMELRFAKTNHPPETLAVRVDSAGRSMAYSADTAPGWSFSSLGDGIDLGLCEATFLAEDEGKAQHLSARQAGAMSKAAGVARLVLTHLQPGTDPENSQREAAETFGAPVSVAQENEDYDV